MTEHHARRASSGGQPSMLTRLRQETSALHDELERVMQLEAEPLTREHYQRFLGVMHAVVPEIEARLARVPNWLAIMPHAEQRRRARYLSDDLEAIGGSAARSPLQCVVPEIAGPCCAFGASYVLEGSTLGGVVIARKLGPALGLTPQRGARFLCAYGAELRERWSEFVAALERWGANATEQERERAVQAARATFQAFIAQASTASFH